MTETAAVPLVRLSQVGSVMAEIGTHQMLVSKSVGLKLKLVQF
jgi:hypothetical protein